MFEDPRLAALYDAFEGERSDLAAYLAIAEERRPRRVLDLGCGTGSYALLLARHGFEVVGVDPAAASLAVAMKKPGAEAVRWLCSDGTALAPLKADLVTMTGNVAQAITDPVLWKETLGNVRAVLSPDGHLVFETRDPKDRAWEAWLRRTTRQMVALPDIGTVESWTEVTKVDLPLVSFSTTFLFHEDGETRTSESALRFREREEVERDLFANGYEIADVRGAPDRPGRELVFIARARTSRGA
jgi:SAM-dependent methyltransferase